MSAAPSVQRMCDGLVYIRHGNAPQTSGSSTTLSHQRSEQTLSYAPDVVCDGEQARVASVEDREQAWQAMQRDASSPELEPGLAHEPGCRQHRSAAAH